MAGDTAMIFEQERTVGADFDNGRLTVVQCLHRNNMACLEKSFSLILPEGSVSDQARILREFWEKSGMVSDSFVLTFPSRKAIVKTLTLPTVKEEEIRNMLAFQAARLIPLKAEEMVVDYQGLETLPEGSSKIALIVLRKKDVREQLAVFEAAGIYPARLVIDSFLPQTTSAALGAALAVQAPRVVMNLLSSEERGRGLRVSLRRDKKGVILQAAIFVALLSGFYGSAIYSRKAELRRLDRELAGNAAQLGDLRRMQSILENTRGRLSQEGSFLSFLAELNHLVPASASLSSLNFESGKEITVNGTCRTLSQAVQLVETLQKSSLFRNVELQSSKVERIHDQDVVDFTLFCRIKAEAKQGSSRDDI
jgi:Tfp pilus assembly protein PilN